MRISLLFSMSLSSLISSAKPVLELSEEIVDFGAVRLDETVHRKVLLVKNVGDEPLVINQVSSTCHCVEAGWWIRPIEPGASDTIQIDFEPDVSGRVSKKLIIYSNAQNRRVPFRVKADVHFTGIPRLLED